MAEQVPESGSGGLPLPPRIKLNIFSQSAFRPAAPASSTGAKSATSRIELAEARAGKAPDQAKKSTTRIETAAPPVRVMSETERVAAAHGMAEKAKRATSAIPKTAIPDLDAGKRQTARIDLQEVLGGDEDLFKRRTVILDPSKIQAAEAVAAPKTIRIKRPDGGTGPVKPVSEPMVPAEPVTAEARKSETARIELPAEIAEEAAAEAPTRRKTIRIKRPEGGGAVMARPLVLSQPSVTLSRAEPAALRLGRPEEEVPSTLFAVFALVALLVACVLIYVLATQVGTVESLAAPNMPFPGGV